MTGFAPDFVVIGAMKSGTTWMRNLLLTASSAHLPDEVKETFYFDRHYDRGLEWYSSNWRNLGSNRPIGEISSSYYAVPEAVDRLAHTAPDARLTLVLRKPAERSWSHYQHFIRKGHVHPSTPFEQAVVERPEILGWSRYSSLVEPWVQRFSRRLTVLAYEQLAREPVEFAAALGESVGVAVDPTGLDTLERNESRRPRSYLLSRTASRASRRLHDAGLHRVVDRAIQLGAGKLVEGKSAPGNSPERDRALDLARDALAGEMDACRTQFPHLAREWS